jgi:hypothetical protein
LLVDVSQSVVVDDMAVLQIIHKCTTASKVNLEENSYNSLLLVFSFTQPDLIHGEFGHND